jgi:hypothetical protein
MLDARIILPLVVLLFCVAALVWAFRRTSAKPKTKSRWRTDFEGISPKQVPPSPRETRQVYRELRSFDKTNPKILEDVGSLALKELQQLVEEHHKKK